MNNVVIVSGGQRRDSATHMNVFILHHIPLPSATYSRSLIIHFKNSSMFMSILNSLTILSSPATVSSFSKSMSLFLICE